MRDAAISDSAMAALPIEIDHSRLARMEHNASSLAGSGHLREAQDLAAAAEILWPYSSPELFELLVETRGWSVERYGSFNTKAMIDALLIDQTQGAARLHRPGTPVNRETGLMEYLTG